MSEPLQCFVKRIQVFRPQHFIGLTADTCFLADLGMQLERSGGLRAAKCF